MYWVRVKGLKQDLAGAGLSERERFAYLLAWGVASTFSASIAPREPTVRAAAVWVLTLAITVVTIVRAYRCNGGREGSALLDRYLSLGWVVSLRTWIVVTATQHAVPWTLNALGYSGPDEEGPTALDAALILAGGAYIAWALGRHIRDVRLAAAPAPALEAAGHARLERFVESVERREAVARGPIAAGHVARRPRTSSVTIARRRRRKG